MGAGPRLVQCSPPSWPSRGQECSVGCFCRILASSLAPEAPGPHYSAFNSSKGAESALECKLPLPLQWTAKGPGSPQSTDRVQLEGQGQELPHPHTHTPTPRQPSRPRSTTALPPREPASHTTPSSCCAHRLAHSHLPGDLLGLRECSGLGPWDNTHQKAMAAFMAIYQ